MRVVVVRDYGLCTLRKGGFVFASIDRLIPKQTVFKQIISLHPTSHLTIESIAPDRMSVAYNKELSIFL